MKCATEQQALQFQTVAEILGFAEGFAGKVAKASVERAVEGVAAEGVAAEGVAAEGVAAEGIEAKTLAFASKGTVDTVDIKAFAVAVGYQALMY